MGCVRGQQLCSAHLSEFSRSALVQKADGRIKAGLVWPGIDLALASQSAYIPWCRAEVPAAPWHSIRVLVSCWVLPGFNCMSLQAYSCMLEVLIFLINIVKRLDFPRSLHFRPFGTFGIQIACLWGMCNSNLSTFRDLPAAHEYLD